MILIEVIWLLFYSIIIFSIDFLLKKWYLNKCLKSLYFLSLVFMFVNLDDVIVWFCIIRKERSKNLISLISQVHSIMLDTTKWIYVKILDS